MSSDGNEIDVEHLLAPGAEGGVLESDARLDVSALRAQAANAGARVAQVGPVSTKTELLTSLSVELRLPGYFGHNWDALDEVLRTPEPALAGPLLIIWARPDLLSAVDPAAADTFRSIVATAAAARRVSGAGPLVLILGGQVTQTEHAFGLPLSGPTRIHHVAVVVRSLDAALGVFRDELRLPLDVVLPIPGDGVRIGFLPVGESNIELVEPTDESTGVARFLESRGEGFHHVCLEVDDIARELDRLAADGIELIDKAPRRGAEGPVAFIHPRSCHGVLVELIEATGGPAWAMLGYEREDAGTP